jgi:hypothetical protein
MQHFTRHWTRLGGRASAQGVSVCAGVRALEMDEVAHQRLLFSLACSSVYEFDVLSLLHLQRNCTYRCVCPSVIPAVRALMFRASCLLSVCSASCLSATQCRGWTCQNPRTPMQSASRYSPAHFAAQCSHIVFKYDTVQCCEWLQPTLVRAMLFGALRCSTKGYCTGQCISHCHCSVHIAR